MPRPRRKAEIRAAAERRVASFRMFRGFGSDSMGACWRALMLDAMRKGVPVARAARVAGVSRQAAYKAKARDPRFSAEWDAAVAPPMPQSDDPFAPVMVPIFRGGLQIGYRLKYDVAGLLRVARGSGR